MKELSIEEKAQRYDEAIKKAESLYKAAEPMSGCNVIIEILFPKLKESKDEMIRKEIIAILKHKYGKYHNDLKYRNIPQWIDWLKKQGESYTKRDVDDAYLKGVTNTKNEIEKQYS